MCAMEISWSALPMEGPSQIAVVSLFQAIRQEAAAVGVLLKHGAFCLLGQQSQRSLQAAGD